jgi:hypothetical protein
MVCIILHEQPHELVLSGQQILNADRCVWQRWQWVGMWGFPMITHVACGSLKDVKRSILGDSGLHYLS